MGGDILRKTDSTLLESSKVRYGSVSPSTGQTIRHHAVEYYICASRGGGAKFPGEGASYLSSIERQ